VCGGGKVDDTSLCAPPDLERDSGQRDGPACPSSKIPPKKGGERTIFPECVNMITGSLHRVPGEHSGDQVHKVAISPIARKGSG